MSDSERKCGFSFRSALALGLLLYAAYGCFYWYVHRVPWNTRFWLRIQNIELETSSKREVDALFPQHQFKRAEISLAHESQVWFIFPRAPSRKIWQKVELLRTRSPRLDELLSLQNETEAFLVSFDATGNVTGYRWNLLHEPSKGTLRREAGVQKFDWETSSKTTVDILFPQSKFKRAEITLEEDCQVYIVFPREPSAKVLETVELMRVKSPRLEELLSLQNETDALLFSFDAAGNLTGYRSNLPNSPSKGFMLRD